MEKPASKPNFLFFHMGPGLHAKAEALEFHKKYPHVVFLDQPLDVDYSGLIDWAEEKILHYANLSGEGITLLGHSFGGSVIRGVLPRVADKIQEIRFLNSVYDPFDCFVNLHNVLNSADLKPTDYKSKTSVEKMKFIFELAQNPELDNVYWNNREAHKHYQALTVALPPLSVESFIKVFPDLIDQIPNLNFVWNGPVKIIYSLDDALILREEIIFAWKKIYPKADFIKFQGLGHFAHFESSAAAAIFFKA